MLQGNWKDKTLTVFAILFMCGVLIYSQAPPLRDKQIRGLRGIKVGVEEAEMIEGLAEFIINNTNEDDKIMHLSLGGEFFSYVTGRELLYLDEMLFYYPFIRDINEFRMSVKDLVELKRAVIDRVKKEKPKIVLMAEMNLDSYKKRFPELMYLLDTMYNFRGRFGEYSPDNIHNTHKLKAMRIYLCKE